ncbi:hypothetical protein [Oleidesulfovibrio sp.]|uniref:hypothetical protein n=1 Tax=Oleidesulfovibrio sp. TaxID=2909707 RepID=UPI003A850A0F
MTTIIDARGMGRRQGFRGGITAGTEPVQDEAVQQQLAPTPQNRGHGRRHGQGQGIGQFKGPENTAGCRRAGGAGQSSGLGRRRGRLQAMQRGDNNVGRPFGNGNGQCRRGNNRDT